MSEALIKEPFHLPPGGWTVDDLDLLPESHHRYELTDGALSVSPSPSSLHQVVAGRLFTRLEDLAPDPYIATQAVEIRFGRQLTRIPDVLVVRSDQPARHWFSPAEVIIAVEIESPGSHIEDRITKPALYARNTASPITGASNQTHPGLRPTRWASATNTGSARPLSVSRLPSRSASTWRSPTCYPAGRGSYQSTMRSGP